MGVRELPSELRPTGLADGDRHAALESPGRGRREARDVSKALEVDADPGHLVHVEIGIDELGDLQGRLVSDARHERKRKRALAHRDVDPEVAALQDHRDSALPADPREGHGPEADAADQIDEAVAVRPEHGQVACSLAQLLLERRSCGRACLREPGGVEDGASRAEVGELPHDLDAGGRVHRDEDRVGYLGKGIDARIRRPAVHLGTRRVHRVDRAGESERLADGHRGGRQRAADEGDALRPEQAPDVLRRGAHPRRIARPIRSRWISEVPSQIRSTRASRQ